MSARLVVMTPEQIEQLRADPSWIEQGIGGGGVMKWDEVMEGVIRTAREEASMEMARAERLGAIPGTYGALLPKFSEEQRQEVIDAAEKRAVGNLCRHLLEVALGKQGR